MDLTASLKHERQWNNMHYLLKEKSCNSRNLYLRKIVFKCQYDVKIFWKCKNSERISY